MYQRFAPKERRIYKVDRTISRVRWGFWPGRFNRSAQRLDSPLGQLVSEVDGVGAEKIFVGTMMHARTKTDTGRRGEYPKGLERTVLKELGNLTP